MEVYSDNPRQIPNFQNNPLVVLLLGFITCGLYLIYWNIKAAQVFNALCGREVISTIAAVFAGLCYPVNLYYFFIIGRDGLPELSKAVNEEPKDQGILYLLLGCFFPMVAAMLVQSEINKLYENK